MRFCVGIVSVLELSLVIRISLGLSLLRGFPLAGPSSSSSHFNMLAGLMVPQANCRALSLTLILRYINQRDVTQSDDTTVKKI